MSLLATLEQLGEYKRLAYESRLRELRRLDDLDNKRESSYCTPGATKEDCRVCPARSSDLEKGCREVCLWQH